MTKLTLGSHPFLLGFDQLERLVERTAKSGNDGYPPYKYRTAGRKRLSHQRWPWPDSPRPTCRSLSRRGNSWCAASRPRTAATGVFLHRGIAARQFQRSFVLADGVEVAGASMEHGLLHVDLQRAVPDSIVQTIRITTEGGTS